MTDGERAVAFLSETYRRRVERVEQFAWGELVVTPSLPLVYDANFAIVTLGGKRRRARAGDGPRAGQKPGSRTGASSSRRGAGGAALATTCGVGWEFAGRYVLMAQRRFPDRPADPGVEVLWVGEVDWARGRRSMIEAGPYGEDPELGGQLVELDRRLARAMEVRHLAAVVDGDVVAYAGLYLGDGVAQIEDVATLPAYRNRGLARSVVLHAAAEARRSGADLVFLVADEHDWPKDLYARLGFEPIGIEHVFGRSGRQHSSA